MNPERFPRARLDDREAWPEARLRRYQFAKLRTLVSLAHRELPFYRRRFNGAGFDPEGLRDWDDFRRVPILTKEEVLQAFEEQGHFSAGLELHDPRTARVLSVTSGTLGTAFLSLSRSWRRATGKALARAYRWAGFSPGMRLMTGAPAWHSLAVKESYAVPHLGATYVVPWGTFLPRFAGPFLDTLQDLRPELVSIFLPMLYAVLGECRRRGTDPREAFRSVESLLVNGAPMTPRSRAVLLHELGVPKLFEGLGSSEGLVAMECAFHQGHHVFVDTCYAEIVDPVTRAPLPPGQRGSVLLTSLIPHGSVYIRYDTGDLGEMLRERCRCGRTWPLLEVYDRCANRFVVDGREMVSYDVRLCLDEVPELVGVPFAVIRREGPMSHLRLAIQKPPASNPAALGARVRAALEERLAVSAREEWVEELPARWKGTPVIPEEEWGAPHG